MPGRFSLFLGGLTLIAASLACGFYGAPPQDVAPAPASTQPVALATQSLIPLAPSLQVTMEAATQPPLPVIPERRRITLEYPPKIRLGDSDIIRLTLEIDELTGITPTAESPGNTTTGTTIQFPNLYETHHVIAEARLDMAGVEVRPPELISSPMGPGQPVTFYWSVKPQARGAFKGTAWLFLRFVDKQTGEESHRAVSAQTVQIESTELFGLSAGLARTTGAIGSLVGGILGFPFLDDLLKALFRRLRRK